MTPIGSNPCQNPAHQPYTSLLACWPQRATVRGPLLDIKLERDRLFFPPELLPVVDHPMVVRHGDGARRRLLGMRALSYLEFTDVLENEAIVRAAYQIARSPSTFGLPDDASSYARLVETDEAHHAFCNARLQRAIEDALGFKFGVRRPKFMTGLDAVLQDLPIGFDTHALVTFACVSETLITGSLLQVPRDKRVAAVVRQVTADHAKDEARHHNFFSYVIGHLWATWTREQQVVFGPLFPVFIRLFLDPDLALLVAWLGEVGLDLKDASRIVEETYQPERVLSDIRQSAKATLDRLNDAGVLRDPVCRPAFIRHGLID